MKRRPDVNTQTIGNTVFVDAPHWIERRVAPATPIAPSEAFNRWGNTSPSAVDEEVNGPLGARPEMIILIKFNGRQCFVSCFFTWPSAPEREAQLLANARERGWDAVSKLSDYQPQKFAGAQTPKKICALAALHYFPAPQTVLKFIPTQLEIQNGTFLHEDFNRSANPT